MFLIAVGVSIHTQTHTNTHTHILSLPSAGVRVCVHVCVCGQRRVCLLSGDEQVRLPARAAAVTHCVSLCTHEDGMCVFKQKKQKKQHVQHM